MVISNYSGKEIVYEKVNFSQIAKYVNIENSVPLNGKEIINDNRPLIKLDNGKILHYHSKNNYMHIFNNMNDLIDFFDKKKTNGIAIWYEDDIPIYWYSLVPKEIKQVFSSGEGEILLKYFKELYVLYHFKDKKGVFLLTDNGHFNEANWYPSLDIFNIDRANMIRNFGV